MRRTSTHDSERSPWCPHFAYKYPGRFLLFRLVVLLLLPLLYFSFLVDHVIGKRIVHGMKARVLVMEGDTL